MLYSELGALTFHYEETATTDDEMVGAVEELFDALGYNYLPADRDHSDRTVAIWIVDYPERKR